MLGGSGGCSTRCPKAQKKPREHQLGGVPQIPTELELAEVLSKMLTRDMHMGATDRSLQQRPESFDAVGMMDSVHPFFARMVDRAVLVAEPRKFGIGLEFIRADRRTCADVFDDVALKRLARDIVDYPRQNIPVSFQHTEHYGFPRSAATALAARPAAADHRFVNLNVTAERAVAIDLRHVLADFARHSPRGLIAHAKLALKLFRRDAVARGRKEVHRVKPLLQRHMSPHERRADHRMNVLSAVAGVGRKFRELAEQAYLAAARALEFLAVPQFEKVGDTSIVVREPLHELLNRYRLAHVSLQCPQYRTLGHIRQADNCEILLINRPRSYRSKHFLYCEFVVVSEWTLLPFDYHSV